MEHYPTFGKLSYEAWAFFFAHPIMTVLMIAGILGIWEFGSRKW